MTTDDELKMFCSNIAFLRKRHGYSLKKVAQIMHISPQTLKHIERGTVPPRFGSAAIIHAAHHFGIAPSALFSPLSTQDYAPRNKNGKKKAIY